MQIIQDNGAGMIEKAQSDDGRIQYWPIGNDRLLIDGQDAHRGFFCDGQGREDHSRPVDAPTWRQACDLMAAVDAHNREALDLARAQHDARQADREDAIARSLAGTRGTYADPNTY